MPCGSESGSDDYKYVSSTLLTSLHTYDLGCTASIVYVTTEGTLPRRKSEPTAIYFFALLGVRAGNIS